MSSTPSERDVSKAIQAYLDKRRIYNDRMNSGIVKAAGGSFVHMARRGTPDRWFIYGRGQLGFVEVKRRGKKPTPEQVERHQELQRAGAVVLVADSLDSFMRQFEEIVPLRLSEKTFVKAPEGNLDFDGPRPF